MKICVLFLCIVSLLWIEVNANCPPFDNPKGAKTVKEGTVKYQKCSKFICREGKWSGVGCAESRCEGQTGETPYNYSKPYPECCPQPICPKKQ